MSPCLAVDECLFLLLFLFLTEIWIPSDTNISPQTKIEIPGEKKKEKSPVVNDWLEAHRTRVPNFRALPSKTAWTLDAEQVWGDGPDCMCEVYAPKRNRNPVLKGLYNNWHRPCIAPVNPMKLDSACKWRETSSFCFLRFLEKSFLKISASGVWLWAVSLWLVRARHNTICSVLCDKASIQFVPFCAIKGWSGIGMVLAAPA